jgi:hypothetical protein
MAKLYDLRLVVRKASFFNGLVSIPYGTASDVYAEKNVESTVKDAKEELARMSEAEPRSHAAFLTMRYRDDRKAPGIGAGGVRIDKEGT